MRTLKPGWKRVSENASKNHAESVRPTGSAHAAMQRSRHGGGGNIFPARRPAGFAKETPDHV